MCSSDLLETLIKQNDTDAKPGFIYSVFEVIDKEQQHISFLCQAATNHSAKGVFLPLTSANLLKVADTTVRTMLGRFAKESKLGNYGLYFGNQSDGEVRPIVKDTL